MPPGMCVASLCRLPEFVDPRHRAGEGRMSAGRVAFWPRMERTTNMKLLSNAAVQQYQETGYCAPIRVLSTAEAAALRGRLETFESGTGPLAGTLRQKSHLLFTWLNDLIRHPLILDAVEDIIGPDILCWGSSFFIKEKRNSAYVS